MKSLGLATTLLAALLLSACASTPDQPPRAIKQLDIERMAMIDGVARERGVTVIWVNPPEKREDR